MLAKLSVSGLEVSKVFRRRLVDVVRENIDALAATPIDLGRTSVVIHTIKLRDAKPFKHKLRPIPFARRQYLYQEFEKLLEVGAIFPADQGACPYAWKTVFPPKKNKTIGMCINYQNLNAQTDNTRSQCQESTKYGPFWQKQNISRHWICSWVTIKWN